VSVAAAGIDPSQDGQSGISEICTSSQALHAASCQNELAVQRGLIYSYMQSRRPPQPNRSIGGGLGTVVHLSNLVEAHTEAQRLRLTKLLVQYPWTYMLGREPASCG
jgi:hypothetical protein